MSDNQACENTDREIWREREGDFYADSIHVTKQGWIGINCGGHVIVMSLRNWHRVAQAHLKTLESPYAPPDIPSDGQALPK
jgi:hypothetical protein